MGSADLMPRNLDRRVEIPVSGSRSRDRPPPAGCRYWKSASRTTAKRASENRTAPTSLRLSTEQGSVDSQAWFIQHRGKSGD